MTNTLDKLKTIGEEELQATLGGKVNPTCGVLVAMSIYGGLALISGPVGVGVAIAAGGVAAGSFCR